MRLSRPILIIAVIVLAIFSSGSIRGQSLKTLRGIVVTDGNDGRPQPLRSASVTLQPYGLTVITDRDGLFKFQSLPQEGIHILIAYVGKVTVDTVLSEIPSEPIKFRLVNNSFRLEEVDVTSRPSQAELGSRSIISRNAIAHLQANSLSDIMSLVPGGITTNPDLSYNSDRKINIRSVVGQQNDANAFGTSIVVNGSPLSNNANLQALSAVMSGGDEGLAGGAIPRGGIDPRSVPMYNVESVEVIRGVPSAKYGDLASGAVIVSQRAGEQPLLIEANTNPNVYSVNASKGFLLPQRKGALNIGGTYAYNINDPVQTYVYYQRTSLDLLYSGTFLHDRLSTTTGFNFSSAKDGRKSNPDDEIRRAKSSQLQQGFSMNTSGSYTLGESHWLRHVDYSARIGLEDKRAAFQEQYTAANAAYGMTHTDGAILSNVPAKHLFDDSGKEVTHIPIGEDDKYAIYLPSTYLGVHQVKGLEFQAFVSLNASFFNQLGNTQHTWMLGGDYRTDRNYGAGKMFADSLPPYRDLQYVNSSFRNRSFDDIPALNQVGLYVQDNITARLAKRLLHIDAGLRFDRFSAGRSILAPRVNASLELIPQWLRLKAGYGVVAKGPSLLYLFPEDAYFDYVNINEIPSGRPDALFMTTTRVFRTENPDLKIASNKKREIGLDLYLGKSFLSVTAFDEKLSNGYSIGATINAFQPVTYNQYARLSDDSEVLELISSDPVLAKFNMPNNNLTIEKRGLEYQLHIARLSRLRTEFSVYGAYIRQKSYSNDYFYYDGQSEASAQKRTDIGLYAPGMTQQVVRSVTTTVRATHNIPQVGLAVTVTADVLWNEADWTVYGNDSIPVGFISKLDGQVQDIQNLSNSSDEYKSLLRTVSRPNEQIESFPPLVNFSINLTKEIGDFMRVSFFANNVFRNYPAVQSDLVSTLYYRRNIPFFFGFKLGIQL